MYCVIQEIERRKSDQHGAYKKLESYVMYQSEGIDVYGYKQTGERFERPIKTAYKVSIHESKRVNGVVTKKQYAVTTVGYYDLVEYWIGDCVNLGKVKELIQELDITEEFLWDLLCSKVEPLREKIIKEFEKTEEYRTNKKHAKILEKYRNDKEKFNKKYGVSGTEYDKCYNVFGELVNESYLNRIIAEYERKKQKYRKYTESDNWWNNWRSSGTYSSSYCNLESSNYTTEEQGYLKKIYRAVSKQFHPDNPNGNAEIMKFINDRLKKDWNI